LETKGNINSDSYLRNKRWIIHGVVINPSSAGISRAVDWPTLVDIVTGVARIHITRVIHEVVICRRWYILVDEKLVMIVLDGVCVV